MHKALLESTQGKWIGDVDLNDSAVQERHSHCGQTPFCRTTPLPSFHHLQTKLNVCTTRMNLNAGSMTNHA